ncbi:hypothetical protein Leryth_018485 [Lithospermum erythrorhizon]|nr:hypothetical protein Leryth_018485 [Lithospermum erythrorhizon]
MSNSPLQCEGSCGKDGKTYCSCSFHSPFKSHRSSPWEVNRCKKKKGKGQSTSAQDKGTSVECYTTRYMKTPYSLPNGLSIPEGNTWSNHMNVFHAVQPLLLPDETKKHPSSDPIDAFALSSLYLNKSLNVQFASARREAMNSISS